MDKADFMGKSVSIGTDNHCYVTFLLYSMVILNSHVLGAFTEFVHKTASIDLGFADLIPLNPFQRWVIFIR